MPLMDPRPLPTAPVQVPGPSSLPHVGPSGVVERTREKKYGCHFPECDHNLNRPLDPGECVCRPSMCRSRHPVCNGPASAQVIGDTMQSAASRLAEWVNTADAPYEVRMAALEAETSVADWTELRRQWHAA